MPRPAGSRTAPPRRRPGPGPAPRAPPRPLLWLLAAQGRAGYEFSSRFGRTLSCLPGGFSARSVNSAFVLSSTCRHSAGIGSSPLAAQASRSLELEAPLGGLRGSLWRPPRPLTTPKPPCSAWPGESRLRAPQRPRLLPRLTLGPPAGQRAPVPWRTHPPNHFADREAEVQRGAMGGAGAARNRCPASEEGPGWTQSSWQRDSVLGLSLALAIPAYRER